MGVRFTGNGTGTSSISFTDMDLPEPTLSTSGHNIISQVEHLINDAGIRSSYKKGEAQLRFTMRWSLLSTDQLESIQEFLEKVKHGNEWFTLQDIYIPDAQKGNIDCDVLSTNDIVYNSTHLISALWKIKPIGKFVFATSGLNNNLRRRITEYQAGGPGVKVSPAFPNAFDILPAPNDTFKIGIPVLILPDEWRIVVRSPNNYFDMVITFTELGY